ncbi:hypothetical protein BsWGS_28408 [Bradybaena similaris]
MLLYIFLISCLHIGHDVLGQCQPGWYHFGQSCYTYGESMVTFASAQEICQFYSAHLAEIGSASENTFLQTIAKNKSGNAVWIGATDIMNEGIWLWLSSGHRMFTFLDWAPHQPDDTGAGEDCLGLYGTASYHWNDFPCNQLGTFLCEIDLSTS